VSELPGCALADGPITRFSVTVGYYTGAGADLGCRPVKAPVQARILATGTVTLAATGATDTKLQKWDVDPWALDARPVPYVGERWPERAVAPQRHGPSIGVCQRLQRASASVSRSV
jgi:hypothetical protein